MIRLGKVNQTVIEAGKRIVKTLRLGKSDVQKPIQSAPHGIDSNPVKNAVAIVADTGTDAEKIVIGYVLKDALADIGETHFFATDSDGAEVGRIKMRSDGTVEILGDSDNAVRFSELKTAFDELRTDFNELVTAFNSHTHQYAPGPLTPVPTGPATPSGSPSTSTVDAAKIDEIKVP